MSDKLTGQSTRWSWHMKWEMRGPRYKATEIADKSPEAKKYQYRQLEGKYFGGCLNMSCQIKYKSSDVQMSGRSRLTVERKRSPVNPVWTHNLFDSLSLLDSTFVESRRNKENRLYFLYTSVRHFFVISPSCCVQPSWKNSSSSIQHYIYIYTPKSYYS